jgi:hypothetical protein
MGQMLEIQKRLREAGRSRATVLLDLYEERISLITEGREATPADISAAWSNVLNVDLRTV